MDPASIAIAIMLAGAQPAASEVRERSTPIRCRPAPYYVAEKNVRQMPKVTLENPKGREMMALDRRGRPCHLTRTPNEGRTTFRNAD